jgi:hypothetical protein
MNETDRRESEDITARLDNLAQSLAGEYPPHVLMDLAEAASLISTLRRQAALSQSAKSFAARTATICQRVRNAKPAGG